MTSAEKIAESRLWIFRGAFQCFSEGMSVDWKFFRIYELQYAYCEQEGKDFVDMLCRERKLVTLKVIRALQWALREGYILTYEDDEREAPIVNPTEYDDFQNIKFTPKGYEWLCIEGEEAIFHFGKDEC